MFRKKVQGNLKGVGAGDRKDLSKFRNPLRSARSPRNPECMLRGAAAEPPRRSLGERAGQLGQGCATKLREGAPSRPRAPPTAPGFPAGSLRPALPAHPLLPSPPLPSPPRASWELCAGGAGAEWGRGVSSRLTRLSPSLRGHFPRDWQDPGFLLGSFLRSGKLAV